MLVIPAIDIYDGKCVRLKQGDFGRQTVYSGSPAEAARSFLEAGYPFLHVVDLEGARQGKIVNLDAIQSIFSVKGIQGEVGGGVRAKRDVEQLFELGATRVVIGSVAVTQPALARQWVHDFGPQRVAVALDVKNGSVAHGAWLEESGQPAVHVVREIKAFGGTTFICTDIARDGLLQGPNVELYKELLLSFSDIELIASGGISSGEDIRVLHEAGVSGVILGRALYEGRINLKELARYAH